MESCNVVNWTQKIVLHLTCHGQLKALTVVLKCRPFTFLPKKCDVAVTAVFRLTSFNQSPLPADIIYLQMEVHVKFYVIELLIH